MRILRALLLVLLLANLLLFAAVKGWLGGGRGGEPERLADQLEAQKIVIVQSGATPDDLPAVSSPPAPDGGDVKSAAPAAKIEAEAPSAGTEACRRYAAVPKEKAARIAALAREAKLKVSQKAQEEPSSWWVHIPSQPSRDEVDKRIAELRAAGVNDFFVVQEAGPHHFALSLGLFKLERMALDLRDKLRAKGVAQARVTARESSTAKVTVDVRGAADEVEALLGKVSDAFPGTTTQTCSLAQPSSR